MSASAGYEIIFPEGYWGQLEEDTPVRGCLDVRVRTANGNQYPVAFYDIVRLRQTLDSEVEQGRVHYSEPGLVVLSQVTTDNIRRAIDALYREGYFATLAPIRDETP